MISFIPYASSSAGNVYTVSDGITTIMLECGLPWKKVREMLNFRTSEIAGILVTHSHLDHSRGIKDAAKAGMDVYATKETFEALNLTGHRFIEIEANRQLQIGTWDILPFLTVHDCIGSVGYLMQNGEGENFLFLTDSLYSPVKFPPLSVIAVECNNEAGILSDNIGRGNINASLGRRIRHSHASLETVKKFLLANDLTQCRQIWLIHLSDQNSDEQRMKIEIQEITGVPVYVAES